MKARSGLNREILGTGWYGLKEKLAYKCAVVEIDPAFTSQTCYVCGRVDKASRPSQAEFTCVACGHADHADLNAARNIMASGIGASARQGALALATPLRLVKSIGIWQRDALSSNRYKSRMIPRNHAFAASFPGSMPGAAVPCAASCGRAGAESAAGS